MNRLHRLSRHLLPLLVLALLATPLLYLLYFLSFGPALVLLDRKFVDKHQISTFYMPLMASQYYAPPLFAVAKWYAGFWVDLNRL